MTSVWRANCGQKPAQACAELRRASPELGKPRQPRFVPFVSLPLLSVTTACYLLSRDTRCHSLQSRPHPKPATATASVVVTSWPASAMRTRERAIARRVPKIISTGTRESEFLNPRRRRFPQTTAQAQPLHRFHPAPIPPLACASLRAPAVTHHEEGRRVAARGRPPYLPKYKSTSRNNHSPSIKCQ